MSLSKSFKQVIFIVSPLVKEVTVLLDKIFLSNLKISLLYSNSNLSIFSSISIKSWISASYWGNITGRLGEVANLSTNSLEKRER